MTRLTGQGVDLARGEVEVLVREPKLDPKALAADWLKQARQHLEVKQALDVRRPSSVFVQSSESRTRVRTQGQNLSV
jgi:hypothetical protein